jgi:hypothetical protein
LGDARATAAQKSQNQAFEMAGQFCPSGLGEYSLGSRYDVIADTQDYRYLGEQTIEYIIQVAFLEFQCKEIK